jgi:MscS family membrane protein
MTLDPQLQNTLAKILIIVLIILLTLLFRRMAPAVARRIIRTIWRFINVVRRRNAASDSEIAAAITPPLRLLITIIGLHFILAVVEIPLAFERTQTQIFRALVAFTVFWTLFRLVDIVAAFVEASPQFFRLDHTVLTFSKQVAKALILLFLFIAVMSSFGFDLAGVVAGLGIGGLAVALAAQDALANLIGYFVIVADAPFKVGHYVAVNGVEGSVEAITFRSTRLRKMDRALIVIPNQTIVNGTIINWSRVDRRQLRMTLGVTYGTTEDQLRAVIADIHSLLNEHERIIQSEQKLAEFVEYGASSLNILISCFLNTISWDELQAIKADINYKLMRILQTHGVGVAFPTTTINFDDSVELLRQQRERETMRD